MPNLRPIFRSALIDRLPDPAIEDPIIENPVIENDFFRHKAG
jgi:hypothetical protein